MNESAASRFGLPNFDLRDEQQVNTAIDDELTFHVEQLTRELVDEGQSQEEARANALARFGDINKVKMQCKRIALKERIMLQRINLILMIVVLLAVALVSVQMYITQKYNTLALQAIVSDLAMMKVPTTPEAASPAGNPGWVYIYGDISRPGVYGVRPDGFLMLSQLMLSAGLDALPVDVAVEREIDGKEKVVWTGSITTIRDLSRGVALTAEDVVTIKKVDEL